jgi:dipeptidyl aminopeptidase/acylaminoacyl peptidase
VSSTAAPPEIPPVSSEPYVDPDALIKEARERQRRRRRRGVALVVAGAAVAAASVAVIRGRSHTVADIVRVPGGPVVNVAAFAGHGRLAFISGRTIWILDGGTKSLRRIATPVGLYPSQPSFSHDGRWLAFVRTTTKPLDVPGSGAQVGQLWLARGDGSGAHPVHGLANALLIGWSPTADVLAVEGGPISKRVPFGSLTTVRLVSPDGGVRTRVAARAIWSAVWSPNGEQVAAVTADGL